LVEAFLVSTGLIFLAELGDKSQLMALAFATRFRARTVLLGITVATAIVHLASVVLGSVTGNALPTRVITVLAGVAFLGFAAWTLRGDSLTDEERSNVQKASGSAVFAVGLAFFLAELGDKTMLATVTLATDHGLLGTWLGSTVGMVLADALAIGIGMWLGRQLPERAVRLGSAAAFVIFGALLIGQGLGSGTARAGAL
jgi:putative Ca2+/H+ antiporter (TMEM165/GDT1 family)